MRRGPPTAVPWTEVAWKVALIEMSRFGTAVRSHCRDGLYDGIAAAQGGSADLQHETLMRVWNIRALCGLAESADPDGTDLSTDTKEAKARQALDIYTRCVDFKMSPRLELDNLRELNDPRDAKKMARRRVADFATSSGPAFEGLDTDSRIGIMFKEDRNHAFNVEPSDIGIRIRRRVEGQMTPPPPTPPPPPPTPKTSIWTCKQAGRRGGDGAARR